MMGIYETIKNQNERYSLYNIRRKEYQTDGNQLPFRVSPEPLKLEVDEKKLVFDIGSVICNYMKAVIELYANNEVVREILSKGNLSDFFEKVEPQYLFIRPDLILTNDGLKICELETSVFGLALAEILNKSYIDCGQETLLYNNVLKDYIATQIDKVGIIAYSERVKAFRGQLEFLADEVFSTYGNKWKAQLIDENTITAENIYRAFYTSDSLIDENVKKLINTGANFIPSITPQFEGKAVLALIWDKRFLKYFKERLGVAEFNILKRLIPPTWILGEETNFELGMPKGIANILEISNLAKSQRKLVLKKSVDSSWGEGIMFLHKTSHEKIQKQIQNILDSNSLYIIQKFTEGRKINMSYFSENGIETMKAKIRITPYYAFSGNNNGKLIAIKATGCEKTDYIHGASNSINTTVA